MNANPNGHPSEPTDIPDARDTLAMRAWADGMEQQARRRPKPRREDEDGEGGERSE